MGPWGGGGGLNPPEKKGGGGPSKCVRFIYGIGQYGINFKQEISHNLHSALLFNQISINKNSSNYMVTTLRWLEYKIRCLAIFQWSFINYLN